MLSGKTTRFNTENPLQPRSRAASKIEILGKAYVSTELSDAIVFGVLIIVLLVKPTGLLGKKVHEKV